MAMTFSHGTRWLEMARFSFLSLADNGFFLLRFLGIAVSACLFCMPPHLRPLEQLELVPAPFFVRDGQDAARRFFATKRLRRSSKCAAGGLARGATLRAVLDPPPN